MNRQGIFVLWAVALFTFVFPLNFSARSQSQSEPQSKPAPKIEGAPESPVKDELGKVWTEDDLIRLRKPGDVQEDPDTIVKEKTIKVTYKSDTASPNASSDTADSTPSLSDSSLLPKTVEETLSKIGTIQHEIAEINSGLEKTKEAYLNAPDSTQRSKLKFDVDLAEDDLKERKDDLELLEDHLELLKDTNTQPSGQTEPALVIRPENNH